MRFINPYALIYDLKNHKHMVNEVCINNDYQNICCLSDTCHVNQELKKMSYLDQSIAVELEQLLDKYYSYRITQCSWERFADPQDEAEQYFESIRSYCKLIGQDSVTMVSSHLPQNKFDIRREYRTVNNMEIQQDLTSDNDLILARGVLCSCVKYSEIDTQKTCGGLSTINSQKITEFLGNLAKKLNPLNEYSCAIISGSSHNNRNNLEKYNNAVNCCLQAVDSFNSSNNALRAYAVQQEYAFSECTVLKLGQNVYKPFFVVILNPQYLALQDPYKYARERRISDQKRSKSSFTAFKK
ncbi:hypothetical protein [Cysteiniphilum litorale]|uniref:hypothetical protein n=1 Tax=Cysteiniphilum litorale TaxID=2056700 RepID=UPI003F884A18